MNLLSNIYLNTVYEFENKIDVQAYMEKRTNATLMYKMYLHTGINFDFSASCSGKKQAYNIFGDK